MTSCSSLRCINAIADGCDRFGCVPSPDIFASYLYGAMGALGSLPPVPLTLSSIQAWRTGRLAARQTREHGRFWKTQLRARPAVKFRRVVAHAAFPHGNCIHPG